MQDLNAELEVQWLLDQADKSLPNDLQHWDSKGHCSNSVSLVLNLLLEAFLVSVYKLLQLSLQQLSKMLLTLLHHSTVSVTLRRL